MSSLLGAMSIAMGALQAQQAGLATTTNNIANLNTPGYTRERPVLQEADPVLNNGIAYGTGVKLQGIEGLRDSILNLQIDNETQQQGQSQSSNPTTSGSLFNCLKMASTSNQVLALPLS